MPSIEAEAHARSLLTTTKLAAVLRPQHVVTIKDSASVDQTLRVIGAQAAGRVGRRAAAAVEGSWLCCTLAKALGHRQGLGRCVKEKEIVFAGSMHLSRHYISLPP